VADSGEKFRAALTELGISRVVCIDDRYETRSDIETILAWATVAKNQKPIEGKLRSLGHTVIVGSETGGAELRQILEQQPVVAVKCQALIDSAELASEDSQGQMSDDDRLTLTDRSVLYRLDELMIGFPKFLGLTPAQWDAQRVTIIGSIAQERTLFIFDESLGHGQKSGTDYIRELSGELGTDNAYYGLLSYTIETGREHERTREFQAEDIVATAISKRDLRTEVGAEHLQVRLRAAVMWKESKELRSICQEALLSASQKAHETVHDLTPLEFDEVVFRTSFHEGVHEMDTLVRIYSNVLNSHFRESLRQNDEALTDIDLLRSFRAESSPISSAGSRSWQLQRAENYDSGDYINSCRIPLDAGDVFEIIAQDNSSIGEFVLVAAPCDMVIRSRGRECGVRKAESCLLCPVERRTIRDGEKGVFSLDFYDDDTGANAVAHLTRGFSFDLWPLDLCAINSDGEATIRLDGNVPAHLSDGCTESVKIRLIPTCQKLVEDWDAWQALSPEGRAGASRLFGFQIPVAGGNLLRVSVTRDGANTPSVALGLKRKQRLSQELAAEMVQSFADHLSRPARAHSLSLSSNMS
jgi:hypothetical protein